MFVGAGHLDGAPGQAGCPLVLLNEGAVECEAEGQKVGRQGQSTAKPRGPADGLTAATCICRSKEKGTRKGGQRHHPKEPGLQLCREGAH